MAHKSCPHVDAALGYCEPPRRPWWRRLLDWLTGYEVDPFTGLELRYPWGWRLRRWWGNLRRR